MQVARSILQFTLNPDGENCVTEKICIGDIDREITAISDNDEDEKNKTNSEEKERQSF